MTSQTINTWDEAEAYAAFLQCCGATSWAAAMMARRPFASEAELLAVGGDVWRSLAREDWLEAFAAHPKIGDLDALRDKFSPSAAWSAEEQGSAAGAAETTLQRLAEGNGKYEAKFGFIFIVCATGKTAGEMLILLEERLNNGPDQELHIAAAEQEKITRLRLQRLCS